jgi:hypothetical protein
MELEEYLRDGESRVCSAEAYKDLADTAGRLTLTKDDRLVFVKGKNAIDVAVDSIDTIEYKEAHFPREVLGVSGGFALLGVLAWVALEFMVDLPISSMEPLLLGVGAGAAMLVVGMFYRRAQLIIHTQSGEYRFTARGSALRPFPNAIRDLD